MKDSQCLNGYCAQWFDRSLNICPYCELKLNDMKEQSELTEPQKKLRNSIAMQLNFYTYSDLSMDDTISHIFSICKDYAAQFQDSSPIEGIKEAAIAFAGIPTGGTKSSGHLWAEQAFEAGANWMCNRLSEMSKDALINAAKYGYDYHATTQFPEMSFDENCKNNFLQSIQGENLGLSQKEWELREENERMKAALQEITPVLHSCANMVSFIDGGGTGAHSLKDVASALIKKYVVAKEALKTKP